MTTFDVCVIGAGPAGLAAASVLASAGLHVCCVTGTGLQRDAAFGETLSPTVMTALRDIGLHDDSWLIEFDSVEGTQSTWGSAEIGWRSSAMTPGGSGWFLDRTRFEDRLADHARSCGASFVHAAVSDVARDGRHWRLRLDARHLNACHLLFATGRGGGGGAGVLPPGRWLVVDRLVAVMTRLACEPASIDRVLRLDACRDGWLYTARAASGDASRRIVSLFTDGDLLQARGRDLPAAVADRLRMAPCVSRVVHPLDLDRAPAIAIVAANTSFREQSTGDGWICCGDAAQTHDPLSSLGIVWALEDAVDAARTHLCHLDGDSHALSRRESRRRHRFADYLRTQHRYYGAETRWSDAPFWQRRHEATQLRRSLSSVSRAGESRSRARSSP